MRLFYLFILLFIVSTKVFAQPNLIPYQKKLKWGFCNSKKQIIISAEFDDAFPFTEGFALVIKDKKYGLIDEDGKILNDTWYDYAESFSEGLAVIKNNKGFYGYIDRKGNNPIPFQFNTATSFHEGFAQAGDEGSMFVIDYKGNKISFLYNFIASYCNGFAAYSSGKDEWGFLDRSGQPITNENYYEVGNFSKEGLAAVRSSDFDQKIGFIDTTGKLVIPFQFENDRIPYFSEGMAPVSKNGLYGFINTSGDWVINPQYSYAVGFNEGLTCVFLNEKCGFIDKKGKVVIPIQYNSSVESDFNFYFSNGLAGIYDPEKEKIGFINKKGKTVIPFKYNYLGSYIRFGKDGLAKVPTPENYLYSGFINKKGKQYWEGIPAPKKNE
jgi:hypothetical protein